MRKDVSYTFSSHVIRSAHMSHKSIYVCNGIIQFNRIKCEHCDFELRVSFCTAKIALLSD